MKMRSLVIGMLLASTLLLSACGSEEEVVVETEVVTETETDKSIVVELKVAPDDMGRIIGKQGRIAKAIRAVVKAAASKEDKKVIVDIMQ